MSAPPRQSAAFWFTSNFLPGPLAIGFVGPLQGLGFWLSLLAIIPGVLLGSLVARRQRAFLGTAVLLPLALILHTLHLQILTRMALHLLPGSPGHWLALALLLSAVLALLGPPLLHRAQVLLAPLLALVLGLLGFAAPLLLEADTAPRQADFSWSAFVALALLAALWQSLLPALVSQGPAHYLGLSLPALGLMSLGALMASAIPAVDTVLSLRLLGERFIPGLGNLTLALLALAMLGSMATQGRALFTALATRPRKTKPACCCSRAS
ncbi:hypothetical protein [Pseudomonas putida]|uniref:Uncharacterized protein n=1 Tax=Pseudomonas putida TaxID=303 RepID=A0A1Q9RB06_PSEPU|nr:hypothetical protein [Pseudomonas putida]OLS64589.1 hypothetical protein PSEMO_06060 [Pseudomonas putida]